MNAEAVKAIVMAVIAALIFSAGWLVEGWRKDAQIADLKATQKAAESRVAQQNLYDLVAARRRGDQLQLRLTDSETKIGSLTQEKSDAIRRLTVGRPCLDSAVVRVLNRTARLKPPSVPEAASEPARTDGGFATDTDVGLWIGQCQRGYNTCRGRLGAISEFFKDEE